MSFFICFLIVSCSKEEKCKRKIERLGANMEEVADSQAQLEQIKSRISDVQSKSVDTHSQEFEGIHADLSRVLSEIDGL